VKLTIGSVLAVIVAVGFPVAAPASDGVDGQVCVGIERIDTALAWASPGWGYNAPKIVRNAAGEMWAVNFFGKYGGHERARVLKRSADGRWIKGAEFDSLYQPSMIFLDPDGRLNYVQNSQTLPIRHYRSSDDENLNSFSLIATGNGLPDGRGWYVGVAVHGRTMFMAYVTLTYDLYLTWKDITSPAWHDAVLIEPGLVDTARGNHSWLYPRFAFFGDRGYITVSSTVDGSKYNTYDKVCMASFLLASPEQVEKELVYEGAVGYYSYCYDVAITNDSLLLCAFNAGRYRYGPRRDDILPAGLYVAARKIGQTQWSVHQVDEGDGAVALFWRPEDGCYAVITRGSWDQENHTLLKRSTDGGQTWSVVVDDVLADHPEIKHQFFAQGLRTESGSTREGDTLHALMTNHASVKPVDGLYDFDLLHLSIRLHGGKDGK